jgi:hypothetical protein
MYAWHFFTFIMLHIQEFAVCIVYCRFWKNLWWYFGLNLKSSGNNIYISCQKHDNVLHILIQATRWRLNMIMSSDSFCYNCFKNLQFMYWRWWYACLAWVWHSRNHIFMKNQWCLGPNIGFTTKFSRIPKKYLV